MISVEQDIIEVRNLVSHYGERQILNNVDFTVKKGEIRVIMGGSGSGKSTLLNHMLGLLKPTSGSINIDELDILTANRKNLSKLRQKMGVAFQGGALFSSMTVGENIKLPLKHHTELDDKYNRIS